MKLPLYGMVFLLLLGSLAAADMQTLETATTLKAVALTKEPIYALEYESKATLDKTVLSAVKTEFSLDTQKIATLELANQVEYINGVPYLKDCDLFTCTLIRDITPSVGLQLSAKDLTGGAQFGNATVQKVFYMRNESYFEDEPTYGTRVIDFPAGNNTTAYKYNETFINGSITVQKFRMVEETDLSTLKMETGKTYRFYIRFTRPKMEAVDIYDTFAGIENKEAAWWNTTWIYKVPCVVNSTVNTTQNFPAKCVFDTTNSTLWNTATCTNVRFVNSTEDGELNYDLDNPAFCNNATTAFWVGVNATNSSAGNTTIYAYLGNTAAASGEKARELWANLSYSGVWHMNDGTTLVDELGYNNLTARGTTANCYLVGSSFVAGSAVNITGACDYYKATITGVPTANNPSSEEIWVKRSGTSSAYSFLLAYGGTGTNLARVLAESDGPATQQAYSFYSAALFSGVAIGDQWGFKTGTYTSGDRSLYLNATRYNDTYSSANTGTGAMSIGAGFWGAAGQYSSYGVYDEARIRSVQSSSDYVRALYAHTSSIGATVENANAAITAISILPASPTVLTPLTANITVQGSNLTYNGSLYWFKNGVNQTALATTFTALSNNTNTQIGTLLAGNLSYDENWSFAAYAQNETLLTTLNYSVNRTVASNVIPAINSVVISPSVADTTNTLLCYVNATSNEDATFNMSYEWYFNGANQTALAGTFSPFTNNTNTSVASLVMNSSTIGNWSCNVRAYDGYNYSAWSMSVNVTVEAYGLYLCNATLTTPSINYSFIDEETGLSVNTSLTASYVIGSLTTSFTQANNTTTTCITPSTASFSANATDFVSATGYVSRTLIWLPQTYSNASILRPIAMLNTTATLAQSVLFSVVSAGSFTPYPSYTITVDKYSFVTSTYTHSASLLTDVNGQTSGVFLIQTPKYNVTVYDTNGVEVYNNPDTVFCQSGTVPCQEVIQLGSGTPTYYVGTADQFQAFCNFSNTTFDLTCAINYTPINTIPLAIQLTLVNASPNNWTIIANNYTGYPNATLIVNVPNVTGIYKYDFQLWFTDNSTNLYLNYSQLLETGMIQVRPPTPNQYAKDGWIFALFLVLAVSLALSFHPSTMILGAGFATAASSLIGLITLEPTTFITLIVMTLAVAFWVKD